MWWLAIPVVMEGRDFLTEMGNRKHIEELVRAHCCDEKGHVRPGTTETEGWVLVVRQLPDGRHILHARDKTRDGARSSEAVREYYCDPATGSLRNSTTRQAFGWKANLRH